MLQAGLSLFLFLSFSHDAYGVVMDAFIYLFAKFYIPPPAEIIS